MADGEAKPAVKAEVGLRRVLRRWGESPIPSTGLASLVLAQSVRPVRWLHLAFVPVFLTSTYLNLLGFEADSAGITGSWSAIYFLLARRQQRQTLGTIAKFGYRGLIGTGTQATCIMNAVACGYVYVAKKGFHLNTPDLPS